MGGGEIRKRDAQEKQPAGCAKVRSFGYLTKMVMIVPYIVQDIGELGEVATISLIRDSHHHL